MGVAWLLNSRGLLSRSSVKSEGLDNLLLMCYCDNSVLIGEAACPSKIF